MTLTQPLNFSMTLENLKVLITGGTSGLGLELVREFLKAGSQVFIFSSFNTYQNLFNQLSFWTSKISIKFYFRMIIQVEVVIQ